MENNTVENLPLTETIAPATQAEVAVAVRNAAEKGVPVYPIGGGTMLDRGLRPSRPGIGLSLAKLNRVVDYPADDLTITVEAGVTIGDLNRRLAAQRQWLPVDVLLPDRATVGGAVAVNAAGPRRYAYSTMRDYVLGCTAVDGTGTVFSGGGRVVKNAAGYNMCRLMTGSFGTLGVITQVTLMVRPLCEASAFVASPKMGLAVAEQLLAGLIRSATRPVAIELIANSRPEKDSAANADNAQLYVGFEGTTADVHWMAEQLCREWAEAGVTAPILIADASVETLWRSFADSTADVEIRVLPSAVVGLIGKLLESAPPCAIHARAGDGLVRLSLWNGSGEGQAFSEMHPLARIRAMAAAFEGTTTVLRHPEGVELSAADMWGPAGPELRLMQAIKERFDPKNILNPGRFVY
jgi:glycolate oxidase FAD binding subunit